MLPRKCFPDPRPCQPPQRHPGYPSQRYVLDGVVEPSPTYWFTEVQPDGQRFRISGRDTKEVLAELVGKLKEKLDPKKVAATSAGEKRQSGELRPNLDRLTVGVDLGDQRSHYCIMGLEGETLAEGQLRTTQQHIAEFFQALNAARVVFEVGTRRKVHQP